MTEIHGPTGLCSPVTLSNEQAQGPIRAWFTPAPPGSGRPEATLGQRTAHCRSGSQPAWSASHNLDPTTGSGRSR
jgi:hypothetical protein